MKLVGILIAGTIFSAIIYGANLFVIWTHQCLLNKGMTTFCFIIPLFVIIYIILMLLIKSFRWDIIFCGIYIIFAVYLGYLLYIFLIAIIIRIIDACIDLSSTIGIPILYGTPGLICIYGIINALITKIIRINLKFPGYKEKTTILHLSDIHLGPIHQKCSIERIVRETKEINPDIVVITGDMADGLLKVKAEWLRPFDELTMPILYITGNHEEMNPKQDMINAVELTKINYIGIHGRYKFKNINFIGEDFGHDLSECLVDVTQEEGVPNVLLYHVPNMRPEELAKYNIFLFLAGHTHGGQLFPLHIFAYFSNACFSGLYSDQEKKHHVFVSEGVNNNTPPMRVGCSRVFGLITIEGEEEII